MVSQKIINETFDYFNKHVHQHFVVKPSIPILYFGDIDAYRHSKIKIVTVGKNPSDNEFRRKKTDDYSFFRFKKWNPQTRNLVETLNNYFYDEPLKAWFSTFEPILNGFGSTYYNEFPNRAIHTDICSPIATFPTWSNLGSNQDFLFEEGIMIWKKLIDELQPDYILVSIPSELYVRIINEENKELISFDETKNGEARPSYKIYSNSYTLSNGKIAKIIFGQAAQKPFGKISKEQKKYIGTICLR